MIYLIAAGVAIGSFVGSLATSLYLHKRVVGQRTVIQAQAGERQAALHRLLRTYQQYLDNKITWGDVGPTKDPVVVSKQLFIEHLTHKQAQEFRQMNQISVKGSDGKRYTIACHRDSYNVSDGRYRYCTHTESRFGVPMWDELLAQKLMIETDINAFMVVANKASM